MSRFKMLIAVLILGLGGIGAYLIIVGSSVAAPEPQTANSETADNNPVSIEPIASSTVPANLTEILTDKLAENITKENTGNAIQANGQNMIAAPKPEQVVKDLIAEAQKNFDPESLRPKITDADVKISEDNSKDALRQYFYSLSAILTKNAQNLLTISNLNEPDNLIASDYNNIAKNYQNTADDLYKLAAPRLVLDLHKKEIELIVFKKNIFEKVANMETDPMTALLATDEMSKLDAEFSKLDKDTDSFIKSQNL